MGTVYVVADVVVQSQKCRGGLGVSFRVTIYRVGGGPIGVVMGNAY